MKKLIDIEKLLQWAMRDELPKGRPVSADIGASIATRLKRRAFGIAASFSASRVREIDSLGFVPGAPHEDAEIVADAIAALSERAIIATKDDARKLFGEVAAIAEPCIPALMSAIFNPRALIVMHALAASRPRWEFDCPKPSRVCFQRQNARGQMRAVPLVEGFDADGCLVAVAASRKASARGIYDLHCEPRSPLQWGSPNALEIGEARAEYFAWHHALCALSRALAGKMKEYEPTPAIVRPFPWITGQGGASRVLDDGKPAFSIGLPLQPKRAAGARPIESKIVAESRPRANVLRAARASLAVKKREMAGNAA